MVKGAANFMRAILDCGGKRSATPLSMGERDASRKEREGRKGVFTSRPWRTLREAIRFGVPSRVESAVAAPLCRRSPYALICLCLALASFTHAADTNTNKPTLIVITGAGGEDDFGKVFAEAAQNWKKAAEKAEVNLIEIGTANATNDLELFRAALAKEPTNSLAELWIVLLGHGTFDGREAKFNLHGPDLSASTLSNLLAGFRRPVAIINAAPSSAPFIKALARKDRVIVTATRSGAEENYTRFNRYISQAIADPEADLDKDGQTSLLEAYLMASRRVTEFYKSEGRLATEHALLDDNGDGFGVQADWFRGIHAVKKAANNAALDGTRAHQWHLVRSKEDQKLSPEQRQKRDALELEIGKLREQKSKLNEDEYYKQLEVLLTKLAEIELTGEK